MGIDSIDDGLFSGGVGSSDRELTDSFVSKWEGREVSKGFRENKWSEDRVGLHVSPDSSPSYRINYYPIPPQLRIRPLPTPTFVPPQNVHIPRGPVIPPAVVQPPPFRPPVVSAPPPRALPPYVPAPVAVQPATVKISPPIINPPPMPSINLLPLIASSIPNPIEPPSIRVPEFSASAATSHFPLSQNPILAPTIFQSSPMAAVTIPIVHDVSKHLLTTPLNQNLPSTAIAASNHSGVVTTNPVPIALTTTPVPSVKNAVVNNAPCAVASSTAPHTVETVKTSTNTVTTPTIHISKSEVPVSLTDKTRNFFSTVGSGLAMAMSDTAHDVWGFISPFREDIARLQSLVSNKFYNTDPSNEYQKGVLTKEGHVKIDGVFDTSLAFRHEPNYEPPIKKSVGVLPPPTPSMMSSLVGRIGRLTGFGSVEASATRTGSIASEVIKDVSAAERAGLVGQEIKAVKNVSQVSGEARVGSTAQKIIMKNKPVANLVVEAEVSASSQIGRMDGVITNEKKLFNFTETAAKHMNEPQRMVPAQALEEVIRSPMSVVKDPQGVSNAMMHYSQIWRNGKMYNIEVLYDKPTDTIMHFRYSRDAMGPLQKISN